MVVGAVIVAVLTLGGYTVGDVLPFLPSALHHLNVGVLALLANIIVCALVSAFTRERQAPTAQPIKEASTA